jgi:acetoin utilization deacetylase AcuC-like enzyme
VLYASVHVDPADGWFPHLVGHADERGGGAGEGWTHNEPIPAGSGDEPWLDAIDRLLPTVRGHGSEALVVSLGVDAAVEDLAAPLMVTSHGFREAGARLGALGMPTVFVQEGGYDLSMLVQLVLEVLESFELARH